MRKVIYPRHAYPSFRAFKVAKRREIRAVQRTITALRYGCAYLPCGSQPIEALGRAVAEIRLQLSDMNWKATP